MIHEENCLSLNSRKHASSLTFEWDMKPKTRNKIIPINDERLKYSIKANKSFPEFIFGLRSKSSLDGKLPPIVGSKLGNSNHFNEMALQEYDVRENTFHIRNVEDHKTPLIDHRDLKGTYIKDTTFETLFKSNHKARQQLSNHHSIKTPTLINRLYSSMSSLRLDNRQDWAANDHARCHVKRQQHYNKVNHSKKSPSKRLYPNSSSSGHKSDANSKISDDYLPTVPSSESQPIIDCEYDDERREAIEKCLKWMNDLPSKFSGLHILEPATS